MGFSCIFPGAHKIGAATSGPRIADKKFHGHEDFLIFTLFRFFPPGLLLKLMLFPREKRNIPYHFARQLSHVRPPLMFSRILFSMPNMTGRPGRRTMKMIGGSSASYLARTPCVPLFSIVFNRGGNRRAFRLPGQGGDRFHCTVEPSPGHIRCRFLPPFSGHPSSSPFLGTFPPCSPPQKGFVLQSKGHSTDLGEGHFQDGPLHKVREGNSFPKSA